jgi:hypothetical protein
VTRFPGIGPGDKSTSGLPAVEVQGRGNSGHRNTSGFLVHPTPAPKTTEARRPRSKGLGSLAEWDPWKGTAGLFTSSNRPDSRRESVMKPYVIGTYSTGDGLNGLWDIVLPVLLALALGAVVILGVIVLPLVALWRLLTRLFSR